LELEVILIKVDRQFLDNRKVDLQEKGAVKINNKSSSSPEAFCIKTVSTGQNK